MARIPQTFIDDLLARTDIVALIERYLTLKKAGNSYQCLCPFHDDRKPSMHVIPNKQFYYCFSCGASGNAITFLMEYEHLSFIDAIESLASDAGIEVPHEAGSSQDSGLQILYDLLSKVAQFYQKQLNSSAGEKAKHYFVSRGLSEKMIEHFSLGFAPDAWDSIMKRFAENDSVKNQLLQTGLMIEKNTDRSYDRFRNRVMFPIRDQRGRVIGFGGRVMDDSTPKYLNSPETPLFHKGRELYGLYEARKHKQLDTLLVVEGYMDVISLAESGIHYAVATLGTAVTNHHIERLLRTVKHVVFCFDGDSAGKRAAWKALEIALRYASDDVQLQFMFLPDGEDPDSLVKRIGQSAFEAAMQKAPTLSQFLLETLSEQQNLETLEGRAQLVVKAMPMINLIKGDALRTQLLQALSDISHTDLSKLEQWQKTPETAPAQTARKQFKEIQQTPIRYAVTLLLQHPSLCEHIDSTLPEAPLKGLKIFKKIVEIIRNSSYISCAGILEHFRNDQNYTFLSQLAVAPLLIPESALNDEFISTLKTVKTQAIDSQIEILFQQAKNQGLSDQDKQLLQKLLFLKQNS